MKFEEKCEIDKT